MKLVEVSNCLKTNQYLEETLLQLEKDFLSIGINFNISKPVESYTHLLLFTKDLVEALNKQDPKRIVNLLYRIDLPEGKVQEEMKNTQLTFSELLAELIVKRELKKVILRNYYSNPENQ